MDAGDALTSCSLSLGFASVASPFSLRDRPRLLRGFNPPCRFAGNPVFLRGLFRRRAAALAQQCAVRRPLFPQSARLRGRYAASFHTTNAASTARPRRRCGRDGLAASPVPRTGDAGVVQQHCRSIAGRRLDAVVAASIAACSDGRTGRRSPHRRQRNDQHDASHHATSPPAPAGRSTKPSCSATCATSPISAGSST